MFNLFVLIAVKPISTTGFMHILNPDRDAQDKFAHTLCISYVELIVVHRAERNSMDSIVMCSLYRTFMQIRS